RTGHQQLLDAAANLHPATAADRAVASVRAVPAAAAAAGSISATSANTTAASGRPSTTPADTAGSSSPSTADSVASSTIVRSGAVGVAVPDRRGLWHPVPVNRLWCTVRPGPGDVNTARRGLRWIRDPSQASDRSDA